MIHIILTWLALPLLWAFRRRAVNPPSRILIIQAAKIGDAICSTPMFRELRAGFPKARIAVLCNPMVAPLLFNNPRLDEVIPVASSAWRGLTGKFRLAYRLRRARYDAVLCCNGGSLWPVVTLWAGIPRRVGVIPNFGGVSQGLANRLWTSGIPHHGNRMIVETYFEMLRAVGATPRNTDKEVFAAPDAELRVGQWLPAQSRSVGLAVSAANKLKELGAERLTAVVRGLLTSHPTTKFILLGTAADADRAADVLAGLPTDIRPSVVDTCGRIRLEDLPALLAKLDAFVGVDSGLTYMADALNVPLVSVAGPCNMAETRPVGVRAQIIQRNLPCLPCAHIFHAPNYCRVGTLACIRDIHAAEIVEAIEASLKGTET